MFDIVCYFIILVFEEFSYFIVSLLIFSLIDVDRVPNVILITPT